MRLKAVDAKSVGQFQTESSLVEELTGYENILVGSTDKLHRLLSEDSHILVRRVARDVFVGAVVESNENVEKNCQKLVKHNQFNNSQTYRSSQRS